MTHDASVSNGDEHTLKTRRLVSNGDKHTLHVPSRKRRPASLRADSPAQFGGESPLMAPSLATGSRETRARR